MQKQRNRLVIIEYRQQKFAVQPVNRMSEMRRVIGINHLDLPSARIRHFRLAGIGDLQLDAGIRTSPFLIKLLRLRDFRPCVTDAVIVKPGKDAVRPEPEAFRPERRTCHDILPQLVRRIIAEEPQHLVRGIIQREKRFSEVLDIVFHIIEKRRSRVIRHGLMPVHKFVRTAAVNGTPVSNRGAPGM